MKTILVNPDAKIYRNIPPLALAYFATIKGLKVIDQNTKPKPEDRFLENPADDLGIFVRSISLSESERVAKKYKKKFPKAKIKSIYTPIDVQCCYPTIQFGDVLRFNKSFGDGYPFPDFSLFDSFDVWLSNWQTGRWPYGILTSVGCPFQCTYCAARNRGWHTRSPENCLEELERAKRKYGIKSFEILDDAFNVDKKRVIKFCKLVKSLGLKWQCANGLRADLFDKEEAEIMANSGCESVSFGVESVSAKVLTHVKKGETIEQITKAVDIAKKFIRNINGFFIIGLPGSSYKADLESIKWVIKKRITGVFSYYVPLNEQVKYDNIFYGKGAVPFSSVYPKYLQKKIYEMTSFMSEPITFYNFPLKVFKMLSLIYKFDRNNFFPSLFSYVRKFFDK